MRTIDATFKVDSMIVKAAPTMKTYRILESSASTIKILCLNRTRDIPYCDSFDCEEIILIKSMRPNSKCCVVQAGVTLIWHEWSMLESMIRSTTEKDSKTMSDDLRANLIEKFPFVEQLSGNTNET